MTTGPAPLPGLSGHLVSGSFLSIDPLASRSESALQAWRACVASLSEPLRRLGPASMPRTILESVVSPLVTALGFERPDQIQSAGAALTATLRADGRAVGLLVAPWAERLDACWRPAVVEARRRSAAWALLCNGVGVRIVDAGRLYSRRFAAVDLVLALDHPDTFTALWQLARAAALCAAPTDARSLHAIVAASDRHAAGVCGSLRDGVLAASTDVLRALVGRTPPRRTRSIDDSGRGAGAPEGSGRGAGAPGETFEQAVTIVYRLLFLLFAEARALVPLWHPVYRESYSIESLREMAEEPAAPGFWDALRAIARLAHAGCRAGDLLVTPFNGRLFAPSRTPLAERRDLDDELARRAVLSLSTRVKPDRSGRERIVYRDLGVEQLGAVYETLLDYQPVVTASPGPPGAPTTRGRRGAQTVRLETGSGVRKATGTFYTPQAIAEYVVRRTLAPLVRDAAPEAILGLRILDPAMGSGAFLVAACRYLASAYEHALVERGSCHPSDIDHAGRVAIRRLVAERCLYGVDINPMAVQLARLSMWLATLAADRPLSFLDHRLTVGDSLLGAWLGNLRRRPAPGRQRGQRRHQAALPLFPDEGAIEALRSAMPIRFSLESTPNDTLEQVRAKERQLAALHDDHTPLSRWKRIADVWCASWFSSGQPDVPAAAFDVLADAILGGDGSLPAHSAAAYLEHAQAIARAHRFFHWELEFPEVFCDSSGQRLDTPGFDAIIGNPPWDMMRADAGDASARTRAREDLSAIVRFTRRAGVYTSQTTGHANRYQLFVERGIALARHGGRIGLVLPSGLATDHGSAPLRRLLLSSCDVDALVGVDNHHGIFPIHRSVRFLLLTATAGPPTRRIACRFGVDAPADLEALAEEDAASASFPVHVSPATLERLSGAALTIPQLPGATDLAICEKAAALFPPLGDARGWSAAFGRELNATDDRDAFRPGGRGLAVVEGKHLEPFRVSLDRTVLSIPAAEARRRLGAARVGRGRLAYRDVASATNRVTLIAAILPATCVSTHTVFCLRTPLPMRDQHFLCGLFNSLVVNYFVRLRTTTHVTTATVEALPIPGAGADSSAHRQIAALARRLARRADPDAFATLNALVARLYQLTRDEFLHILETFPLVPEEQRHNALATYLGEARMHGDPRK